MLLLVKKHTKRLHLIYQLNLRNWLGLDARGFLFGPLIALRLGAAFVPVRKQGKLPGECVQATYIKEYGEVSTL